MPIFVPSRRIWTRQPQYPVGIDWSNPLARGLVAAIVPSAGPRESLSGATWNTFGTAPVKSAGSAGIALDSTGADGGFYFTSSDGRWCTADQTHFALAEYTGSSGTYIGFIGSCSADGSNGSFSLQEHDGSGDLSLFTTNANYFRTSAIKTSDLLNVGLIGLAIDGSGADVSIYKNGALAVSGSSTAAITTNATSALLTGSARDFSTSYNTPCRVYLRLAWNRRLSAAEHKRLYANPWQLFAPANSPRFISLGVAGGGAVTGTLATTEGADTAAITGAVRVAGTLAATEGADSAAVTGSVRVSGALASTEAADSAAATGSVLVAGSLAATESADTLAGTGVVLIAGSLAATEGADTLAGTGVVLVTGTLAATEAADTAEVTGTVVSGSVFAATEDPDTFAGTGAVLISGAVAATESADSVAATGIVLVTGTIAATEGADTIAVTGSTAGASPITGAMGATEVESDLLTATGAIRITGVVAATEESDTMAFLDYAFVRPGRRGTGRRTDSSRRSNVQTSRRPN